MLNLSNDIMDVIAVTIIDPRIVQSFKVKRNVHARRITQQALFKVIQFLVISSAVQALNFKILKHCNNKFDCF